MVFAGPRDRYQTALALEERGLLGRLVTDAYFGPWLASTPLLGPLFHRYASVRHHDALPAGRVKVSPQAFARSLLARLSGSKSSPQLAAGDVALSRMAGRLALEQGSPLVAYSYYATEAFRMMEGSGLPRILFQVHPHGAFLREIYRREIEVVPAAAASLKDEAEMSAGFDANDEAVRLADAVICTSSFTKRSLLAAGCKAPIEVIPYGVDLTAFSPRTSAPSVGHLRVAFVGTLSQRKGATHLMKALSGLGPGRATLVLCARSAPDPILLRGAEGVAIEHRRGLADGALAEVIKGCDLLVLPSIAEGFGLVILEAMACGVPVLCTDATGGADFIVSDEDGWVVPSGDAEALRAVMANAAADRARLAAVGRRARLKAESLGWDTYRRRIAEVYAKHAA